MIPIASLLNPFPSSLKQQQFVTASHDLSKRTARNSPSPPPRKKQKLPKDGPIFTKGKVRGEVKYKPCEYQNEEIAVQHRRLHVYPMGKIADYCRHIPYNSEKKSFLEKTGRESFEGNTIRARYNDNLAKDPNISFPIHVQGPW